MEMNVCENVNHDEGKIIKICFNSNCKANRVCCYRCLFEFHKDHLDQSIEIY